MVKPKSLINIYSVIPARMDLKTINGAEENEDSVAITPG